MGHIFTNWFGLPYVDFAINRRVIAHVRHFRDEKGIRSYLREKWGLDLDSRYTHDFTWRIVSCAAFLIPSIQLSP